VHPLTAHPLPGLDARRLHRLEAAGLAHLEDLVAAGPDQLAALTGFDLKTCRALVRLAEGALDRTASAVIPLQELSKPTSKLGRGLNTARRIEKTHAVLRKVAAVLPAAPSKPRWRRPLKRVRKQLARLEERLTLLQQGLLAEGVSAAGDTHLREVLEDLEERVEARLAARPCRRTFRKLARLLRDGRKLLAG
jgi:hypothetical protein